MTQFRANLGQKCRRVPSEGSDPKPTSVSRKHPGSGCEVGSQLAQTHAAVKLQGNKVASKPKTMPGRKTQILRKILVMFAELQTHVTRLPAAADFRRASSPLLNSFWRFTYESLRCKRCVNLADARTTWPIEIQEKEDELQDQDVPNG